MFNTLTFNSETSNSKDKEKILNLYGEKYQINSRPLHRDLADQKRLEGYIQGPKGEKHAAKNTLSSKALIQNRRDKELPRQAETERICDHQTSSARNIKGDPVKERGSPKK